MPPRGINIQSLSPPERVTDKKEEIQTQLSEKNLASYGNKNPFSSSYNDR